MKLGVSIKTTQNQSYGKSKASHFEYTSIENVLRDPTIFTSREVVRKMKMIDAIIFLEKQLFYGW